MTFHHFQLSTMLVRKWEVWTYLFLFWSHMRTTYIYIYICIIVIWTWYNHTIFLYLVLLKSSDLCVFWGLVRTLMCRTASVRRGDPLYRSASALQQSNCQSSEVEHLYKEAIKKVTTRKNMLISEKLDSNVPMMPKTQKTHFASKLT